MTFYDLLEAKARDEKTKDKVVFVENKKRPFQKYAYYEYTYQDLYNAVNEYIKQKMKPLSETAISRKILVVADNSVESVVAIIALLKCNFIPVVMDLKNAINHDDIMMNTYTSWNFPLISDRMLGMKIPIIWDAELYDMYADIKKAANSGNRSFGNAPDLNDYIEEIQNNSQPLEFDYSGGEIVICSSGSENSVPHFNVIKEEDLISNKHVYGVPGSTFLSYITCANISGILTNLVNPLLYDTRVIFTNDFDINLLNSASNHEFLLANPIDKKDYLMSYRNYIFYNFLHGKHENETIQVNGAYAHVEHYDISRDDFRFELLKRGIIPDSVMLPRDILEQLANLNLSGMDLSRLKHIYLAGGANTYDIISTMREMLPTIPAGVFENLYGSTEALGVISTCSEDKMKTCYIDLSRYNGNPKNIVYTYDKVHFYQNITNQLVMDITDSDNIVTDFLFNEYLSASEGQIPYLSVDRDLTISFRRDSKKFQTGDSGIYINNQLYVLGRKKDFVKPLHESNAKWSVQSVYNTERILRKILGTEVYCVVIEDTFLQIFINTKGLDLSNIHAIYNKIFRFQRVLKTNLKASITSFPILLNDDVFPKSKISGKVSKGKLAEYQKYSEIQAGYVKSYPFSIRKAAKYVIGKLFSKAEVSKLDLKLRFKVKAIGSFEFYSIFDGIEKAFDIVMFDDEKGEIVLQVKPSILFLTDEEIEAMLKQKNVDITNATMQISNARNCQTKHLTKPLADEENQKYLESYCKRKFRRVMHGKI